MKLNYLENDNEREDIKNQGHKKAILEHGYLNRIRKIMEKIS